jgi:hypothetical protein
MKKLMKSTPMIVQKNMTVMLLLSMKMSGTMKVIKVVRSKIGGS